MKYYKINKKVTRDKVRENKDVLYLFGDNTIGKGLGGQAKEMRGEPNTVGIVTKRFPSTTDNSYFIDEDYETFKAFTNQGFRDVIKYVYDNKPRAVVEPPLGVGLADLPKRAPECYKYLRHVMDSLKHVIEMYY